MSDMSLADLADSVDYGGVTTAEALQVAYEMGQEDADPPKAEAYVYRVVYRAKNSDLPWEPLMPWNSPTGRPYVKESVAKGIMTQKRNRDISRGWDQWEYDVQRSPVKWESIGV